MRVAFHTFGCKLNQYETEALADPFRSEGYSVVGAHEHAELYIINTCTVTARADHKARALVRSISRRNPSSLVVVTGCAAQLDAAAFSCLGQNVVVVSQEEKPLLLDLRRLMTRLNRCGNSDPPDKRLFSFENAERAGAADPFRYEARNLSFHTRVFLKIQDGCNARCSYCRVPDARGESVSLDAETALERAEELAALGFGEIVLTGVNICAYRSGMLDFAGLVEKLMPRIGEARLRLSSIEPDAVTDELLRTLSHPKICAHFHLCVQSGSDAVLAGMRRRYTAEAAARAAAALRGVKDDPFLAADMITGFPGETEEDFISSISLARGAGFSALHVFPFSPRKGTEAAGLAGQVPERVRSERAKRLLAVSRELGRAYRSRWVGREVEVLIEESRAGCGDILRGTTSNYLKVIVQGMDGENGGRRGKTIHARIVSAGGADGNGPCSCRYP
jgi:threonylcarbamoyladenosine tRNA methylthiotransferase MtaB